MNNVIRDVSHIEIVALSFHVHEYQKDLNVYVKT